MTFAGSPEQSRAEGRQSKTAMQSPRSLLPAPYSYCTRSLFGTPAIDGVAQTFPSASRLLPPESSHFLLQPARTSRIGGAARPFSIPTTRSPWSLVFGLWSGRCDGDTPRIHHSTATGFSSTLDGPHLGTTSNSRLAATPRHASAATGQQQGPPRPPRLR